MTPPSTLSQTKQKVRPHTIVQYTGELINNQVQKIKYLTNK